MNRTLKWILILLGGGVALVIAALLIIPSFLDINDYKPQIEKQISQATGRPVTLTGDIDLSLFPFAGISLGNLNLGNPKGFEENEFVSVKSFEARVKLIPLLSKDIQVKRFIVKEPKVVLIKKADGRGNWEMPEKAQKPSEPAKQEKAEKQPSIMPKDLSVGEFAIENASVVFIDKKTGARTEVKNANLVLENVSFDKPIGVNLDAMVMGFSVSLTGKVGPVGKQIGDGTLPLDLQIKALDKISLGLSGKIENPATEQKFDLSVKVEPFSLKNLAEAFGQGGLIETSDPSALDHLALSAKVKGDPGQVSISDGVVELDQSKITLSAEARQFDKPAVSLDMNLDQIDVDRYLPPAREKPAGENKSTPPTAKKQKPVDYTPMRKLVLDANITIGVLKVQKATIENIRLSLTGKDGRFSLDPLSMDLYQGSILAQANCDVRGNEPKSQLDMSGKNIQVEPLLTDLIQKDFLEGTTEFSAKLNMEGISPERIKRSLNGNAAFTFIDGAIKGINLHAMVQKAKALIEKGDINALTMSDAGGRTDFSRFHAPFTFNNGVASTTDTSLVSPALRLSAEGKTDLVEQSLDFKVEPKLVATVKGQGDEQQRQGLNIPLLVTGTYAAPKFRPDMKAVVDAGVKKVLPELQKRLMDKITGEKQSEGEEKKPQDQVKDLLKSLPFGKQQ